MKTSFLMTRIVTVMAIAGLLSLSGCIDFPDLSPKEKQDTLPAMTTTGENIFGCYVDGEVWVPKGTNSLVATYWPPHTPNSQDSLLAFDAHKKEKRELFLFEIHDVIGPDTFDLVDSCPGITHHKLVSHNTKCTLAYFYDGSDVYKSISGEMILSKLDTANEIMSGEFYFTGVSDDNDTVRITEGRFDLNYIR